MIEQDGEDFEDNSFAYDERDEEIVPLLAHMLGTLVQMNKLNSSNNNDDDEEDNGFENITWTYFHGEEEPGITVADYIFRMRKYLVRSPGLFVVSLIYMDRYFQREVHVKLLPINFHRLFLTCTLLGCKFFDDRMLSNRVWADIGGIDLKEMNLLEMDLLFRLNFELNVSREQYEKYRKTIKNVVKASSWMEESCRCIDPYSAVEEVVAAAI